MVIPKSLYHIVRQRARFWCEYCHYPELLSSAPLSIDPETEAEASLFNPRQQIWSEHFLSFVVRISRKRVSPRNPFSVGYSRVIGYQLGRWCNIMGSKVAQKADQFAISIVNADKYLSPEKKEFILL